jgi:toxin YhaV
LIRNGWKILFHPLFAERIRALRVEAEELKASLTEDSYRSHPRVRLLAAVFRLIRDVIPENPNAPDFQLRADLAKFRRAKSHGLPERYRLFWVFSSTARTIIFLYLNDESTLRKQGSRTDPYELFKGMVRQGRIGDDYETNRAMLDAENRAQNPA